MTLFTNLKAYSKLNYIDKTCIIAGNGKSLNNVPLEFLYRYPSFGTNRIYLLKDFMPDFYVCINKNVVEQFYEDIEKRLAMSVKFIRKSHAHLINNSLPLNSSLESNFSMNPDKWINEGYTVTYVCMQLAFWMGFKTVLLVGVDHSYQFTGQPNETRIAKGKDENHFHQEYFSNGVKWDNPDLEKSEFYYNVAKNVYSRYGKKIINLSNPTKLSIFETGNYKDWM